MALPGRDESPRAAPGEDVRPLEQAGGPSVDGGPADLANEPLPDRPEGGFGRAVSWSYVQKVGSFGVTTLVALVLARLLGPEAFGIVAMAIVYVYLLELFIRQGMSAAVIQRPGLTPAHLDTALWITLGAIGVLAPASIALSGWWAGVNNMPQLRTVIIALTPVLVFKGLSVVQESHLHRKMDYKALAIRTNVAVLAGGVAGIVAAFAGMGVWALVIQQLVMTSVELVLLWILSDWRPGWRFDPSAARELLGFSSRATVGGLGFFLNQRADALLIGLLFGPVPVGLYRMASRFTDACIDVAGGAIHTVSLPELSRFNERGHGFNDRATEIVRLAAVMTVPLLGVVAAISDPLMGILGEAWSSAANVLKLLCLVAVFRVLSAFIGPTLQAAGRPGTVAWLSWISGPMNALAFVVAGLALADAALDVQVLGLAASQLLAVVAILFIVSLPVQQRVLGLSGRRLLSALAPSAAASIAGAGLTIAILVPTGVLDALSPWVGLLLAGVSSTVLIGACLLTWEPLSRRLLVRSWGQLKGRLMATA